MNRFSIKETNIFFILFMLMYVGMSMAAGMLLPENTPEWLVRCLSTVIIVLPLLVLLAVKKIHPKEFLKLSGIGITDVLLAYVSAYCLMPLIILINYTTMFFARNYVNGMVSRIYEYPLAAQLLLMALLPAVAEEFIFRGFFYGSYRRKNVVMGALMSGLVFGLAHLNLNQFAYAFVIGAAFCILYEASDNILIPVTAHFAINANTIFVMRIADVDMGQLADVSETGMTGTVPIWTIMLLITVLFVMGIFGVEVFCAIVRKLAGRRGRLEQFRDSLKSRKNDMGGTNDRFLDGYMIAAIVAAGLYMIALEL